MRKVFIILLGPLFLATSCPKMIPMEMEELDKGAYGAMEETGQMVIENQEEFVAMWEKVHANQVPAPRPPAIDFDANVLICSFMGMKSSGGYGTSLIMAGKDKQENVQIVIQETIPGPACLTTSALTSPYVMATIAKEGIKGYEFIVERDTTNCMN